MRRLLVPCWLTLALASCIERGDVLRPKTSDINGEAGTGGTAAQAGGGGSSGSPIVPARAVISSVSVGQSHTAAISDSRLFTWGANDSGELGQGDTLERHTPTQLMSELRFSAVTSGGTHSCALDELGDVYCWGANDRGQLGQGDRDTRPSPVRGPLPVAARRVSSDFAHVCALLADAKLFCWGRNQEGELGQDDAIPPSSDQTVRDALDPVEVPGANWSFADAGDGHTCAIRLDGSLWCWGRNTDHQLGQGGAAQIRRPIQVGTELDWLHVESGQQYSLALKHDHSLWAWGLNEAVGSGEGNPFGIDDEELDEPTRLGTASDWVTIATCVFHSCAINRGGELWCWGRNAEGQLGTGDTALASRPTRVASDMAEVDVSWFTTCAVTRSGELSCTGKNEHGELGTGTTERPLRFTDLTPAFL